MNSIQRVAAALRRRPVDRAPRGEILIDSAFVRDFMHMLDGAVKTPAKPCPADIDIRFYRYLKLDLVCISPLGAGRAQPDFSSLSRRIASHQADDRAVFFMLDGPFQATVNRLGLMAVLGILGNAPDDLAVEMERWQLRLTEILKKSADSGVNAILLAEDIAYQQGPYLSPASIERLLLPFWQKIVRCAADIGLPVVFHSDGNLNPILPLLVNAGFDGIQCLEPAAGMDLRRIRAIYGRQFCLMGNVDPALLVDREASGGDFDKEARRLSDELKRVVRQLLAPDTRQGGYIFGTCSGLHAGLSPSKVAEMYALADRFTKA